MGSGAFIQYLGERMRDSQHGKKINTQIASWIDFFADFGFVSKRDWNNKQFILIEQWTSSSDGGEPEEIAGAFPENK